MVVRWQVLRRVRMRHIQRGVPATSQLIHLLDGPALPPRDRRILIAGRRNAALATPTLRPRCAVRRASHSWASEAAPQH
ncbi:hypothetical protein ACFQU2_13340 [Siccirubricoccus deserti]